MFLLWYKVGALNKLHNGMSTIQILLKYIYILKSWNHNQMVNNG